ncbi:serine/threonine-protein kinase [Pseudonocardia sp. TRM90224]|uniref:serine/threonine-protein kinase n=1 Tax=Pseudonocardia sp. TRM90224 TaxID=2812678 RepID=UPI001E3AC48B|nr:serine/threonine-protein kinase [Pseudonocardia sp. TRM90224]
MTAEPATAQRIGPYQLIGRIGAGAMGEVHRAVDTAHGGRLVALKLLPPQVTDDPERRARFERESHIVASLTEPHVIDVHSYGTVDGRPYLDMRLVDGPDLAAHLATTGPLPPEHAVAIVEQVAAALDAAHAAGLVHNDVKPSNVLLHRPVPGQIPSVVLADFGIAGDAGGLGTVEYLAPERWQGRAGDQRVDVYALACLLHELLTGFRAFPGAEFAAQLHGHLMLSPPRPSAMRPGVPGSLDAVVAAGMAKHPGQRVPSAGQLAGMARAAITPARGISRRGLLTGIGAGIVVLGGGLAVAASARAGGSASPGGAAPARITPDRALGIRSFEYSPFSLGVVGGRPLAVIVESNSVDDPTSRAWDLLDDREVRPGGVLTGTFLAHNVALAEVDGRGLLCCCTGTATSVDRSKVDVLDLLTSKTLGSIPVPGASTVVFSVGLDRPALFVLDRGDVVTRLNLSPLEVVATSAPIDGTGILAEMQAVVLDGTPALLVQSPAVGMVALDAETLTPMATWTWRATTALTVNGQTCGVGFTTQLAVSPAGEQPRLFDAPNPSGDIVAVEVGGRGIAVLGQRSGDILLYDIVTGGRLDVVLSGHQARITQLGVIASGDRPLLVSAAADNTIRVWDLAVHVPS